MQKKSFLVLCQSGSPEEVSCAIEKGADLEEVDQIDRTALMLAVLYNPDIEVSRILVEAGSTLDHLDVSDMTALHYAVEYSRCPELVELLLQAGSDANTISGYNRTVLMTAVAFNHPAVPLLLSFGADPKAADEEKLDAVMYAIYFNYDKDVVDSLFRAGADPCHRDKYDRDWNDYIQIFIPNAPFSGKKDLAPVRVDLVPILTLSLEEAERNVAWGVNPAGESFWVERINNEGSYAIQYLFEGDQMTLQVDGLSSNIDFCIPFHFPFSWIFACCGEEGFLQDDTKPNLFIVDSSGKTLSSFFVGNHIDSIIPGEDSFWIVYGEDILLENNGPGIVRRKADGSIMQVFHHESKKDDDGGLCLSACKGDGFLYVMFEPGTIVRSGENLPRETIECHQSFSAMAISGSSCLMKESFHIGNLLYEYRIVQNALQLYRRIALYADGKPFWDYDFHSNCAGLLVSDSTRNYSLITPPSAG